MATAVVLCVLVTALGSSGATAQSALTSGITQQDIEVRDELIFAQESLLNVYRCMFGVDTQIVPGGCANGRPRHGTTGPGEFLGTPAQLDVDIRDEQAAALESLLNTYRCMFGVDTQIVPGGCADRSSPAPGEGVRVNMARATWSTGYVQAAIYRALLQDLGYEVSDPSETELDAVSFYTALAEGQFDFWTNGWFPQDTSRLEEAGLTGIAGPVGLLIPSGGLQGILVDRTTAEAHGITKWDDIGNNSEIAALFDLDGDGKADIMGCDIGWNCRLVINDTIAANGWQATIEQITATHADLFADSLDRLRMGEPILQFVWTPGPFTAKLIPGEDAIWLSVDNPLPSQQGTASLPAAQCPAQPCQTGFTPADIRVVARNDFLAANPTAAKLLELATIPEADVSRYILQYGDELANESNVKAAANEWIATHRAVVDRWMAAARAAG